MSLLTARCPSNSTRGYLEESDPVPNHELHQAYIDILDRAEIHNPPFSP
jgi:hypothetical protein